MQTWYRAMWEKTNDVWTKFMREYVFSPDPPFTVVNKSTVLVDPSESRPNLNLEVGGFTVHEYSLPLPTSGAFRIVDNMIPGENRRTGFGTFQSREEAQEFMNCTLSESLRNSGYEIVQD